jgi:hypothetical protein
VRAAIPDQVELDIAAAPISLERALRLAVGQRLAPLHDRQVGRQQRIADRTRHRERGLDVGSPTSSKNTPPMPRGSCRCFRKKYSSHQAL